MVEERWLRIAARLDRLPEVCDFVVEAAETAGLEEREVYHCQMAVDEAVTNVIEHAYADVSTDALIDVGCALQDGEFVITVIDEGPPFDPLARIDPDPAVPLDEREPGGWGIYFIKKMMDQVDYVYRDGRNYLVMSKTTPQAVAGGDSADEVLVWRREVEPGVWVLRPTGRLDSMSSRALDEALISELDEDHKCLIVDMGQVVYISSSGLKVLVGAWRKARSIDGAVVIAEMQPRVQEVFDMVGFDRVFPIFLTVDDAVNAVGTGKLVPGCAT
jgi:anti-anti-sigma factor